MDGHDRDLNIDIRRGPQSTLVEIYSNQGLQGASGGIEEHRGAWQNQDEVSHDRRMADSNLSSSPIISA